MSLEGASKVMYPPVVSHESFEDFLQRKVYHSQELPETLNIAFVPHESSEDFLQRTMYHYQELPEAFNFAHEEKIRRAVLMKEVMSKLRNVASIMIEYSEFLRICIETCENSDKGAELAKLLDHSRNVVLFENDVFLYSEEVAKLKMMISSNQSIVNLVKQKAMMGGFGYVFLTLGFGIVCCGLIHQM